MSSAATLRRAAESRADTATFASLGAPPSLRRRIAGANAALIELLTIAIGVPMLAAALAALATRGRVQMTRRLG